MQNSPHCNYPSRRDFLGYVALAGIGADVFSPPVLEILENVFAQRPNSEHFKLIKEIVDFYYSGVPIKDKSQSGLFLRVVYDRVVLPSRQFPYGLSTRVIFKGEGNEIVGVSSLVPHPYKVGRDIGPLEDVLNKNLEKIQELSAIMYLILNPRDSSKEGLPTLRGGYDGTPFPALIEVSYENMQDKKLDGRLQGILPRKKIVLDSSWSPDQTRNWWRNRTEDDLIRGMTIFLEWPTAKNQYTTEKEILTAENGDYLMVLRTLQKFLGKQVI